MPKQSAYANRNSRHAAQPGLPVLLGDAAVGLVATGLCQLGPVHRAVVLFAAYWSVLRRTDAALPVGDSFTTALSIVATWMLARKYIEYWLIFIVVDAVSAMQYIYKGLYPTAGLFIVYTVMAVVGYRQWRKTMEGVAGRRGTKS